MAKMTRSEAGRLGAERSLAYHNNLKRQNIERYNTQPKLCRYCNTIIEYDKRRTDFCNRSCSASYTNLKRHGVIDDKTHRPSEIYHREPKLCFCGKPAWKKYCSTECKSQFIWDERKRIILNTGVESNSAIAKKYLREICGSYCMICGISEWQNKPVPLVLDHINGHSEDNRIINLRLVCGNCDMQLPTYKSKNIGNGRAYRRRRRYADGKSY